MSRANFVQVKLANAAGAADTTLTIQSGGAAFTLPPADGGRLTLTDSLGAPAAYEIVTYTSRTGTGPNYTLNGVVRGVEGSAARAWSTGAFVLQSLTAGEFDELLNAKEPSIAAATGSNTQFWRGDKTWQDLATAVRAAVLTGLSTASSAAVVATDTLLVAIGKLQAQINGKLDSTATAAAATKLATARNINGVAFDGTADITVTDNTKAPASHTHPTSQVTGLGTAATKNITISTATPADGVDGDIWIQY
jgi:hypothetical protein